MTDRQSFCISKRKKNINKKIKKMMTKIVFEKKLKFLTRGIVNSLLINSPFVKIGDEVDTLIVMGATRSGTTWLSEIVNGIPDSSILFEPLSPTHVKGAEHAGFTYDTYIEQDEERPEAQRYMEKVLAGKVITPWTVSQIPIKQASSTRIWIVKFVRANMLIGWLANTFSVKPPALIIRHPCATVASQMQKGWVPPLKMLLKNDFFKKYKRIADHCKDLVHPEEILALRWCMRYFVPLALEQPFPFVLVCYERLVRSGESEIKRLFERWELPVPGEALRRLKRPSRTVQGGSQILEGLDPLVGWQKKLNPQQVANILNVVTLFGLDFYGDDIEPNYARLYGETPIHCNCL